MCRRRSAGVGSTTILDVAESRRAAKRLVVTVDRRFEGTAGREDALRGVRDFAMASSVLGYHAGRVVPPERRAHGDDARNVGTRAALRQCSKRDQPAEGVAGEDRTSGSARYFARQPTGGFIRNEVCEGNPPRPQSGNVSARTARQWGGCEIVRPVLPRSGYPTTINPRVDTAVRQEF